MKRDESEWKILGCLLVCFSSRTRLERVREKPFMMKHLTYCIVEKFFSYWNYLSVMRKLKEELLKAHGESDKTCT